MATCLAQGPLAWNLERSARRRSLAGRQLPVPGGTQIGALSAQLEAGDGTITIQAYRRGLAHSRTRTRAARKRSAGLDACWHVKEAERPLEVSAEHRLFSLGRARSPPPQRATLDLRLPQVATFAALAGQHDARRAAFEAQIEQHGSDVGLSLDADADFSGRLGGLDRLRRESGGAQGLRLIVGSILSLERAQLYGRALDVLGERERGAPSRPAREPVQGGLDTTSRMSKPAGSSNRPIWASCLCGARPVSPSGEGTVSGTALGWPPMRL